MENPIAFDPFYSELQELYGNEYIERAGWFKQSLEYKDVRTKRIYFSRSTPINRVFENYKAGEKQCVLITTGSFCPVHDGHVEMMKVAKDTAEAKGYEVLAGYFVPDHDEYINMKNGKDAIPIHERIALINQAVKNEAWLFVDPFPGLFLSEAINFTHIIASFKKLLHSFRFFNVDVIFVCGGDNARFAFTFKQKGNCIVITRPGYDLADDIIALENDRIIFAFNNNNMSSTKIRAKGNYRIKLPSKLILRKEDRDEREDAIIEQLKMRFKHVTINKLSVQKKYMDSLKQPVINLDSMLKSEHNLELSRVYDMFGVNFLGYINRPSSIWLEEQINTIPKDSYFLFDDDIHSGGTIRFARELLAKNGIEIMGSISFTNSKIDEEVLDCRDFLINPVNSSLPRDNGLVVKVANEYLRVPYIYPFVCPYARASIHDPMEFSKMIWKINMEYFKGKVEYMYLYCQQIYDLLNQL